MANHSLNDAGYVIGPCFFDEQEINRLKLVCQKLHGQYLCEYPEEVFSLLNNKSILKFVKDHLGEEVCWTGNYEFRCENNYHAYNLHHDAKGSIPRSFGMFPPPELSSNFRTCQDYHTFDFPVYRLFIYLNDLTRASGGTKLKAYSHKKYTFEDIVSRFSVKRMLSMDIPFLNNVNPEVTSGGGILFNARAYHSGFYLRYKLFPRLSMPTFVDNFFKRLNRFGWARKAICQRIILPPPRTRYAIMLDFCYPSLDSLLYAADRYWCGNPALRTLEDEAVTSKVTGINLLKLSFSPILSSYTNVGANPSREFELDDHFRLR